MALDIIKVEYKKSHRRGDNMLQHAEKGDDKCKSGLIKNNFVKKQSAIHSISQKNHYFRRLKQKNRPSVLFRFISVGPKI